MIWLCLTCEKTYKRLAAGKRHASLKSHRVTQAQQVKDGMLWGLPVVILEPVEGAEVYE